MTWEEAVRLCREKGCSECLPAVLVATMGRRPEPNAVSVLVCKEKVRIGREDYSCDEDCPKKG